MVQLKSILRLANRILASDGSGRPASVNLASGTVLANVGAGPVARTLAQFITDLQGAGLSTGGAATPTLVTWAPGELAASATADTSVNIGRASGLLVGVELVRTAGTGSSIKLEVADRAFGTGAVSWVLIGSAYSAHNWPVSGDARIIGPGPTQTGVQTPACVPLVPYTGNTVHFRMTNPDAGAAQTVTARLWWL